MVAALAAGLACVVTTSSYTRDEDFTGAALVVSSLGEPETSAGGEVTADVLADPYDVLSQTLRRPRDPRGAAATRASLTTQQGPCP